MKKFNLKLFFALILLISSFVFIFFGAKVSVLTNVGMVILGISIFLFSFYIEENLKKDILELEELMQEDLHEKELTEVVKVHSKLKSKQRKAKITFIMFAGLLIICGFFI